MCLSTVDSLPPPPANHHAPTHRAGQKRSNGASAPSCDPRSHTIAHRQNGPLRVHREGLRGWPIDPEVGYCMHLSGGSGGLDLLLSCRRHGRDKHMFDAEERPPWPWFPRVPTRNLAIWIAASTKRIPSAIEGARTDTGAG